MDTDRQLLMRSLRNQQLILRLLLMLIKGEQEIQMSQQEIDDAVNAMNTTATDLLNMATNTQQRVVDVDAEVKALQAQLAAAGTPVDTSALTGAVDRLMDSHEKMQAAVQALADDTNVPAPTEPTPEQPAPTDTTVTDSSGNPTDVPASAPEPGVNG